MSTFKSVRSAHNHFQYCYLLVNIVSNDKTRLHWSLYRLLPYTKFELLLSSLYYREQSNFKEASRLLYDAVTIRERTLGEEHPSVSSSTHTHSENQTVQKEKGNLNSFTDDNSLHWSGFISRISQPDSELSLFSTQWWNIILSFVCCVTCRWLLR